MIRSYQIRVIQPTYQIKLYLLEVLSSKLKYYYSHIDLLIICYKLLIKGTNYCQKKTFHLLMTDHLYLKKSIAKKCFQT